MILHWDECDYGTGNRQNLAGVYYAFSSHPQVFNILYSATPEELIYSNEMTRTDSVIESYYTDGIVVKYDPPSGYCGVHRFLQEGLVEEAHPFFVYAGQITLSDQAKSILERAKQALRQTNRHNRRIEMEIDDAEEASSTEDASPKVSALRAQLKLPRNIIVLRLSYKIDIADQRIKSIYPFLEHSKFVPELADVCIYADKTDVDRQLQLPNIQCMTIEWGKRQFWDNLPKDRIVLIVHDQTSTRSTEWVFHDRIFATHDFRNQITFNTIIQAQMRSAHYEQNYGGAFQPIQIYGCKRAFQLAAGLIGVREYLNNEWTLRKKTRADLYLIQHVSGEKIALPNGLMPSDFGYPYEQARQILIENEANPEADIRMAQRVAGDVKHVAVTRHKFYPCNPEDKERVLDEIAADPEMGIPRRFNGSALFTKQENVNDANEDCRWQGYLRTWAVFEYDKIKNEAWGLRDGPRVTVCYNNGVVGLCVRVESGVYRIVNTLAAFKSMYQT